MAESKTSLESALSAAVVDFDKAAVSLKALERHHRQAAQQVRDAQRRLEEVLAEYGIEVKRG